jgi:hypothetical protein
MRLRSTVCTTGVRVIQAPATTIAVTHDRAP